MNSGLNSRSRISGGRNYKKLPNINQGPPGGAESPGLAAENDELAGQFQLELFTLQSTIDCETMKTQKNTKIVRMTSYPQYELSKKSASKTYKVLIFETNEGDFSGTPVKNQ